MKGETLAMQERIAEVINLLLEEALQNVTVIDEA